MKGTKVFFVGLGVLFGSFGLVACNQGQGGGSSQSGTGEVPVYQGMTISHQQATVATAKSMSIALISAKIPGNMDNNGNHNGWYKGDYDGKDQDVDQNNPFPDNEDDENIENEMESSLDVIGAGQEIYYATANEDVYINVHINNPDNYEILSFTLNGEKYSSYMFEKGSDMETLILKYNVGDNSGIQEYTIDAIKYIDGTEIKDVIMEGDKTVVAGIRRDDQVTATVSNLSIAFNDIALTVNVADEDNLIEYSKGYLKAVIYDGESIIATKDLVVGDNDVAFDNLGTMTLYQYAIVGYYDDLSGEGLAINTLFKEAFYTKAIVLFDNIVIGQEKVSFNLAWNSSISNQTLTALNLYKDEALITILDTTALTVSELLSGCSYTLVAEFDYLDRVESISLDFTTLTKQVPILEVVEVDKTSESICFDIIETDVDNICEIVKIEVLHENDEPIVIADLMTREIENLKDNETYTIKVYYTYDLNDGNGVVETYVETMFKTKYHLLMKEGTFTILHDYGFYYNATLNCYYEHTGIDLGAEVGTEIYAFEDGVVESIYKDDLLLGTEIVIDHGNGLKTLYRFVEEVENIKVGDMVEKGQLIATVAEANGNEYKDGPHLHFEISENGKIIDPEIYISEA